MFVQSYLFAIIRVVSAIVFLMRVERPLLTWQRRLLSVALFSIQVSCATFAVGAEQRSSGTGSGFFITPDGFFLTSYHVIEGAEKIRIRNGETVSDAKVVSRDPANDIAILKTEGHFPCLAVGLANSVKIGDDVFTIGFPAPDLQGVAPKLTKGNISATTGLRDDPRFFQISIPVQPGNSGGPLVDERGNAVGIIASTLSPAIALSNGFIPQNVNYAVKTTYAMPLVETIPGIKAKLPSIDASTLKSVSQIREEATSAVGLVIAYGGSKRQSETVRPKAKAPAPDEQAETTEDSATIIAHITDCEKRWQASVRTHDASVANALLSEDFAGVNPSGHETTKTSIITGIASDTWSYEIARLEEVHVKVIGPNIAIATGIGREKGTDERRKPFDRRIAFTDMWRQREGRWQCTAVRCRFVSRR